MLAFLHRILDWFKNVFWKEEMELALVGLQNSGKTTFVNVISVRTSMTGRPKKCDQCVQCDRPLPGTAGRPVWRARASGPVERH